MIDILRTRSFRNIVTQTYHKLEIPSVAFGMDKHVDIEQTISLIRYLRLKVCRVHCGYRTDNQSNQVFEVKKYVVCIVDIEQTISLIRYVRLKSMSCALWI